MNKKSEDRQNTKKDNSYEPIFDLNPTQEEPFDEKTVQLSIYNDIKPEKNKIKKQEEEWILRMTCTQEWFMRCSWINKLLFLEVLCRSTKGYFILENILQSIESIISKDVIESLLNDPLNYVYDRIPKDDNRTLEVEELNCIMQEDIFWFLCLDSSHQVRIILRLLRIGGGGLIFMFFKLVEKIYKERKGEIILPERFSIPSIRQEVYSKPKIKTSIKSQISKQTVTSKSLDRESSAFNNYAYSKVKQLQRREEELFRYKKLKGILFDEGKALKKGETKETVDYLQILPIWLNRKIMSYIDDKSLLGFKKVGKYWGKMIDESINEKSGRKAINAKINKITGIKPDKEEDKKDDKNWDDNFELVMESGGKDLIAKRNENEKSLIASSELFEALFSKKCEIKSLDASFWPQRCGSYDNVVCILASSTSNNTVQFYSTRTGTRMNYLVFGIESPITCVSLHENRTDIFIGCKDGSLISKDIRTNKTKASFNGHKMAIRSIFTSSSNLLSASLDNTIKYFKLWSGLCLLCIDLNPDMHLSCLCLSNVKPSLTVVGTVEGYVIMADVQSRKFHGKVQLHTEEIKQLILDGEMLITGSKSGEIRVWDVNRLDDGFSILSPYYNINTGSGISYLKFYKNQIFAGCNNGTVKIISIATGNIFKTLKISSQSSIMGLDISEDKLFMRLIIWHEKGIEIRSFSLQKSPSKKMSMEKDNRESKQKAPKQTQKDKMSEIFLRGYARNSQGLIERMPIVYHRATFGGIKNPLDVRCCTISHVRNEKNNLKEFNTSVFTKANADNVLSLFSLTRNKFINN